MVQVSGERLRIRAERRDRVCVVSLKGSLDMAASVELTECIKTERAARPGRLVIDMSGVSSVDFGGARALANAVRPVPGECQVIVRSLRPAARQQLELTGFDFGGPDSGRPGRDAGGQAPDVPPPRGLDRDLADSATGMLVREWRHLLGLAEQAIADARRSAQFLASTEDHVAATLQQLAARRPAAADRLGDLAQTARGYAATLRDQEAQDTGPAAPAWGRPGYAASGTVGRAVAFIEDRARDDIGVADIAAAAFVTVRAVQLAFRRYLDTTPLAYLRQVRLERAHQELLEADPDRTTITAIAADWRFTNASRFSAYYRAAYGVPPTRPCTSTTRALKPVRCSRALSGQGHDMTASQGRDIVTVAASAGGLEPLRTLLAALPADFAASVLVVLHIPATGGRTLPRILDRAGVLPAAAAVDGEPLRPGRVYVAPPDRHMLVVDGLVRTSRGPRQNGVRPSADPLFRSAALYGGARTIAVVLSGTLDDAALGAATVERLGGRVVVQDPADAAYDSMPRCALATTQRSEIRPSGKIAGLLVRLAGETVEVSSGEPPADLEEEVRSLLAGDPQVTPVPQAYSGFTCPECGGPLYHAREHAADSYDCLVGHRWSPESLLEEQAATVERAMWLAIRSLDERRRLTERLAESARNRGHAISAARFRVAAEEAALAADELRNATGKLTPVTEEPVEDQLTPGETSVGG